MLGTNSQPQLLISVPCQPSSPRWIRLTPTYLQFFDNFALKTVLLYWIVRLLLYLGLSSSCYRASFLLSFTSLSLLLMNIGRKVIFVQLIKRCVNGGIIFSSVWYVVKALSGIEMETGYEDRKFIYNAQEKCKFYCKHTNAMAVHV